MRLTFIAAICVFAAPVAQAQLYLITGAQTGNGGDSFASSLLRVESDSTVAVVAELVPQSIGTVFIAASYDWQKAVIQSADNTITVIDSDRAPSVKRCKMPAPAKGWGSLSYWLSDAAEGPSFEWLETGADVIRDVIVRGMVLDLSIACGESFTTRSPEAIRRFVDYGTAGVVAAENFPFPAGFDAETGNVTGFVGKHIPLGYAVPASLYRGTDPPNVLINDKHVFAVFVQDTPKNYRTLIFRKSDRTWHVFPITNGWSNHLRALGRYVAVHDASLPTTRNSLGAGHEKWRSGRTKSGPDLRASMLDAGAVFTGKLHLYDVETERVFPIATNDGDSEVLLVDEGTVYYRVSDRIYAAPISDKGVGLARLVTTDDAIVDAHWAFIKH
jgi:hypothetical protein